MNAILKLIAFVLISTSLCLGAVSASTAYMPKISSINADDELTLSASAGVDADGEAVLEDDTTLDVEALAKLAASHVGEVEGLTEEVTARAEALRAELEAAAAAAAAEAAKAAEDAVESAVDDAAAAIGAGLGDLQGDDADADADASAEAEADAETAAGDASSQQDPRALTRVRVKEFSFGRWDLAWLFGLSVVGLAAGAGVIRYEQKLALAEMNAASGGAGGAAVDPEALLRAAYKGLDGLCDGIGATDGDRRQQVLDGLDAIKAEQLEPFIAARPVIVDRIGLSGYARLMDAFAGAERRLNRAWSAAADDVLVEADICLQDARDQLVNAIEVLGAR